MEYSCLSTEIYVDVVQMQTRENQNDDLQCMIFHMRLYNAMDRLYLKQFFGFYFSLVSKHSTEM